MLGRMYQSQRNFPNLLRRLRHISNISPAWVVRYERRILNSRNLLADTERTEDQVQDVISSGGTSNFIQRTQSAVEVQQKHFMRNFVMDRDFHSI